MIEVVIYDVRPMFASSETARELARVTIEGEVKGNTETADNLREQLSSDTELGNTSDGRALLRYITEWYSTGPMLALYDSPESFRIVEGYSDEEYEAWKETANVDTDLTAA